MSETRRAGTFARFAGWEHGSTRDWKSALRTLKLRTIFGRGLGGDSLGSGLFGGAQWQQQRSAGVVCAGWNDQRRFAVPPLDDLKPQEGRIQLQRLAAHLDSFGFALGFDDRGFRLHLGLDLREA